MPDLKRDTLAPESSLITKIGQLDTQAAGLLIGILKAVTSQKEPVDLDKLWDLIQGEQGLRSSLPVHIKGKKILIVAKGLVIDISTSPDKRANPFPNSNEKLWIRLHYNPSLKDIIRYAVANSAITEDQRAYILENSKCLANCLDDKINEVRFLDLAPIIKSADEEKDRFIDSLAEYINLGEGKAIVLLGNYYDMKGVYTALARRGIDPVKLRNIYALYRFAFAGDQENPRKYLPPRNFLCYEPIAKGGMPVMPLYQYIYQRTLRHKYRDGDTVREVPIVIEEFSPFFERDTRRIEDLEIEAWKWNDVVVKRGNIKERHYRNPVYIIREGDQIVGGIAISYLQINGEYEKNIPKKYKLLIGAHDPNGDTIFDFSVFTDLRPEIRKKGYGDILALATLEIAKLQGKREVIAASRCEVFSGIVMKASKFGVEISKSPEKEQFKKALEKIREFLAELRREKGKPEDYLFSTEDIADEIQRHFFNTEKRRDYAQLVRLGRRFVNYHLETGDPFLDAFHHRLGANDVLVVPNSRTRDIRALGANVYVSYYKKMQEITADPRNRGELEGQIFGCYYKRIEDAGPKPIEKKKLEPMPTESKYAYDFSVFTRERNLREPEYAEGLDVLVIGGGIVGAGIARDAALRRLKVGLVDKGDFGSGTSSKTSKLVHAGIRYLEFIEYYGRLALKALNHFHFGEFWMYIKLIWLDSLKLIFEASRERGILLRIAPHLVRPLRFLIPVYKEDSRGLFKVFIGTWLYDVLSLFRNTKIHKTLFGSRAVEGYESGIKKEGLKGGTLYYDSYDNDARLVLENILSANQARAIIANYAEVVGFIYNKSKRINGVIVEDKRTGKRFKIKAKRVINAGGPWIDKIRRLDKFAEDFNRGLMSPTKGSHITVPKISDNAVVISAKSDNRIFFVIPHGEYSLIGTTDLDFDTEREVLEDLAPSEDEVKYLIKETNRVFPNANLTRESVISGFTGVRPLVKSVSAEKQEASRISREYKVVESGTGLISVGGVKLTSYRLVAQEVVDRICKELKPLEQLKCITDKKPLYGGDTGPIDEYVAKEITYAMMDTYKIDEDIAKYLITKYGTTYKRVLNLCRNNDELKKHILPNLPYIKAEIVYSAHYEMVVHLEDFMVRRTDMDFQKNVPLDKIKEIARLLGAELGWSEEQIEDEVRDYIKHSWNRRQKGTASAESKGIPVAGEVAKEIIKKSKIGISDERGPDGIEKQKALSLLRENQKPEDPSKFQGFIRDEISGWIDVDPSNIDAIRQVSAGESKIRIISDNIVLEQGFGDIIVKNFPDIDRGAVEGIIHKCFSESLKMARGDKNLPEDISFHFINQSKSLFGNHKADGLAWANLPAIAHMLSSINDPTVKTNVLGIILGVGMSHEILGHEAGIDDEELLTLEDALLSLGLVNYGKMKFSDYIDFLKGVLEDKSPYNRQMMAINELTDPDRRIHDELYIELPEILDIFWMKKEEDVKFEPADIDNGAIVSITIGITESKEELGEYSIFTYNKTAENNMKKIGHFGVTTIGDISYIQFYFEKPYEYLVFLSRELMIAIIKAIAEKFKLELSKVQIQSKGFQGEDKIPPVDMFPIKEYGRFVLIPILRAGEFLKRPPSKVVKDIELEEREIKMITQLPMGVKLTMLRWQLYDFAIEMAESVDKTRIRDFFKVFLLMLARINGFQSDDKDLDIILPNVKDAIFNKIKRITFIPVELKENELILKLNEDRLIITIDKGFAVVDTEIYLNRLLYALLKFLISGESQMKIKSDEINNALRRTTVEEDGESVPEVKLLKKILKWAEGQKQEYFTIQLGEGVNIKINVDGGFVNAWIGDVIANISLPEKLVYYGGAEQITQVRTAGQKPMVNFMFVSERLNELSFDLLEDMAFNKRIVERSKEKDRWWQGLETIFNLPESIPNAESFKEWVTSLDSIRFEVTKESQTVQLDIAQKPGKKILIIRIPTTLISTIRQEKLIAHMLFYFYGINGIQINMGYDSIKQIILDSISAVKTSKKCTITIDIADPVRELRSNGSQGISPPNLSGAFSNGVNGLKVEVGSNGWIWVRQGMEYIPLILLEKVAPGFRRFILNLPRVSDWIKKANVIPRSPSSPQRDEGDVRAKGFRAYIKKGVNGWAKNDPGLNQVRQARTLAKVRIGDKGITLDKGFEDIIGDIPLIKKNKVMGIVQSAFAERIRLYGRGGLEGEKEFPVYFINESNSLFGNHKRDGLAWANLPAINDMIDRIKNPQAKTVVLGIILGVGLSHEILGHEAGIDDEELLTRQDELLTRSLLKGHRFSLADYLKFLSYIIIEGSPYYKQLASSIITKIMGDVYYALNKRAGVEVYNNLGLLRVLTDARSPFKFSDRFSSWHDVYRRFDSREEEILELIVSYYVMFADRILGGRGVNAIPSNAPKISERDFITALRDNKMKACFELSLGEREDKFLLNYMERMWRDRNKMRKEETHRKLLIKDEIEERTIKRFKSDKIHGVLYFDIDKILKEDPATADKYMDLLERLSKVEDYAVVLVNSNREKSMEQILGEFKNPKLTGIVRAGQNIKIDAHSENSDDGEYLLTRAIAEARMAFRINDIPEENITVAIYASNRWKYPEELLREYSVIIMTAGLTKIDEEQIMELERYFPDIGKLIKENKELLQREELKEMNEELERQEEADRDIATKA